MLRASWLGHWKAPWPLGKGRRWGDPPWTLAALAQAWLLGAKEGMWPEVDWSSHRDRGPFVPESPVRFDTRPNPAWVAQLRHGSRRLAAAQRGAREDVMMSQAWTALLAGDATPWMALGSVLLDIRTRFRWIPVLGAVSEDGRLHLPPFLKILLPEDLLHLPKGWWEFLLSSMDSQGRLLPEGSLPVDVELFRDYSDTLVLHTLPSFLQPKLGTGDIIQLPSGRWMIDPRIRAWIRAPGLTPIQLQALNPRALALGDSPEPGLSQVLAGQLPDPANLPAGWLEAIRCDLQENPQTQPLPPALGHPVWDRLRLRWGAEDEPLPDRTYPTWGTPHHPCADPFHWMAEGRRAYFHNEIETALRAFGWAWAHFDRLKSPFWARRAAFNAARAAFLWADLPALANWEHLAGPRHSPFRELGQIDLFLARGERRQALRLTEESLKTFPEYEPFWMSLAQIAAHPMDAERLARAVAHLSPGAFRTLFEGLLQNVLGEPDPECDADTQLLWQGLRADCPQEHFWSAWEGSQNHLLRLDMGLRYLEAHEDARSSAHLLDLQAIAERTAEPFFLKRMQALWPSPQSPREADPDQVLDAWLSRQSSPAWLVWSDPMRRRGTGTAPPPGTLERLHREGGVAPFQDGKLIWWGFPLVWEGSSVAWALLGGEPGSTLPEVVDVQMLAPWLSRLLPTVDVELEEDSGPLLTDGSEPMASLLRELERVAPTPMPVLILGPTGSGKELVAQILHQKSGCTGPLVAVNCSAFAETLLESELFGHVKGSFTGADRDRTGAIESARGGTLFLDEVADMGPRIQSMLLRVLQEREVRKVGSDKATKVNLRFVAATHKPLEDLVESGAFRRDLYYRIKGTVLRVPGLKDRFHEFPFLVPRLLARICEEYHRLPPSLAPGLAKALGNLPWPGNVRELRHALERALLRCGKGPLKPEHFEEFQTGEVWNGTWAEATSQFQRQFLRQALRAHSYNVAETARTLGLARPALYLTAKRLGLDLRVEKLS